MGFSSGFNDTVNINIFYGNDAIIKHIMCELEHTGNNTHKYPYNIEDYDID